MATSETIKMEIGYEDDGNIIFVGIDKDKIQLVRKALTYLYKQEQGEKKKIRALESTCRNCRFSNPRDRYDKTLTCSERIVNKYYHKIVRPSETCDLFKRKEENE